MKQLLCLLLTLSSPAIASADIYECQDNNGHKTYQNSLCNSKTSTESVALKERTKSPHPLLLEYYAALAAADFTKIENVKRKINQTQLNKKSDRELFKKLKEAELEALLQFGRNLETHQNTIYQDRYALKGLKIGMAATHVMKIKTWGPPDGGINKTITSATTTEQWVYKSGEYSSVYLYFDKGVLTSMQASQ